jgi:hypothetical protein
MKLAILLRIVSAMRFVLDKLATLLRGKGSEELLADVFSTKCPSSPEARLFNKPVFYGR